jgi:hypothetical protein
MHKSSKMHVIIIFVFFFNISILGPRVIPQIETPKSSLFEILSINEIYSQSYGLDEIYYTYIGDCDNDNNIEIMYSTSSNLQIIKEYNSSINSFDEIFSFNKQSVIGNGLYADVDDDANMEVIFGSGQTNNEVYIFEVDGDNSFSQEYNYTPSPSAYRLVVGDADNDGRQEIIDIDKNAISFVESNTPNTYIISQNYSQTSNPPAGLDIGNIDGDSNLDIVISKSSVNQFEVWEANGDNSYSIVFAPSFTESDMGEIVVGNFNDDSSIEIAYVTGTGQELVFIESNGDNSYIETTRFALNSDCSRINHANIDDDPEDELILGTKTGIQIWDCDFGDNYVQVLNKPVENCESVAMGFIDGDTIPDFVVAEEQAGVWYLKVYEAELKNKIEGGDTTPGNFFKLPTWVFSLIIAGVFGITLFVAIRVRKQGKNKDDSSGKRTKRGKEPGFDEKNSEPKISDGYEFSREERLKQNRPVNTRTFLGKDDIDKYDLKSSSNDMSNSSENIFDLDFKPVDDVEKNKKKNK